MIYVSPTPKHLAGQIVVVRTYAIEGKEAFSDDMSFEEGFESIRQSIEHLSAKLTSAVAEDLSDMCAQARTHFESGEIKLGANLMQDMEQVVQTKPPFAYPEARYRWSRPMAR